MASPVFGEFIGTAVLVLLGDGVVGGVLLKGSKAENAGWMVITAGWAFAVFVGVVTAVACGSPDAHLNPAVTLAAAIHSGNYSHLGAVRAGANAGWDLRRDAGVDLLPLSLAYHRGCFGEAGGLLHGACGPESLLELFV